MRITTDDAIGAERDILARIDGLAVDLSALAVASNLWRASQAFRLELEGQILQQYDLSWSSFSTLFIVWVWGPIGMSAIAEHQAVARPTITSTVKQLEKRNLCKRVAESGNGDRRTVQVTLTTDGVALIEEVFPKFNQGEANFVSALSKKEQATLAGLLRKLVSANKV